MTSRKNEREKILDLPKPVKSKYTTDTDEEIEEHIKNQDTSKNSQRWVRKHVAPRRPLRGGYTIRSELRQWDTYFSFCTSNHKTPKKNTCDAATQTKNQICTCEKSN